MIHRKNKNIFHKIFFSNIYSRNLIYNPKISSTDSFKSSTAVDSTASPFSKIRARR